MILRTKTLGILLCAAALLCYLRARSRRWALMDPPEDGYEELEDGPEDL